MRTFNFLNSRNETKVHSLLERIAAPVVSVEEYRNAFQSIGYELGTLLRDELSSIPEAEIIRFDREDIIRTSGRKIVFCTSNGVDCMENAMMDLMYRIPSDDTIQKVIITKEVIDKTGEPEIIQGEPSGKNRNQL